VTGREHLAAALLEALDDEALDELARRLAPRIHAYDKSRSSYGGEYDGWLSPAEAAKYIGTSRKRIYDLTSSRAIEPDGYDGRSPRFSRATLDAYLRDGAARRA
jgi:excisionase family DNA binding protein